jgi:hypothetical protein
MVVLAKDENLNYLLGSSLSSAPPSMGGAKFVITTRIDEGTCIVANLQEGRGPRSVSTREWKSPIRVTIHSSPTKLGASRAQDGRGCDHQAGRHQHRDVGR